MQRFLPASLLLSVALAGCTSSNMVDMGVLRPSNDMTSSITRPQNPAPDVAIQQARAAVEYDQVDAMVADPGDPPLEVAAALVPALRPLASSKALKAIVVHPQRFRDAKPINFGSQSPKNLAVHGVDVSRWQGTIDWQTLRSRGANFVYIKATDGGDHIDPMFKTNWRAAHTAGLKRGAYHFFYWCRTASEQADWFIRNVPRVAGALPPVIDVEWNGQSRCRKKPSPAVVREKMQVFMDRLEAHYGQRPVIYTAPDFYADNLRGAFKDYPFWLRAVAQHPSKVYPDRKWVFWQYSGSGLSHGVDGRIDLNAFHGSDEQWRTWLARVSG